MIIIIIIVIIIIIIMIIIINDCCKWRNFNNNDFFSHVISVNIVFIVSLIRHLINVGHSHRNVINPTEYVAYVLQLVNYILRTIRSMYMVHGITPVLSIITPVLSIITPVLSIITLRFRSRHTNLLIKLEIFRQIYHKLTWGNK